MMDEPKRAVLPGVTLYEIDNTVASCMYGDLRAHGPDTERVRMTGKEAFARWKREVMPDFFESADEKKLREDLNRLGEATFARHWDTLRAFGEQIGMENLFRTMDAIYRRREMS